MSFLSTARPEINIARIKRHITEGKSTTESNDVFKTAYYKHLLKKTYEDLADGLSTDSEIAEEILKSIETKINDLNNDKFNIKVVKLLKEEIESQVKNELEAMAAKKTVITLEEYMENKVG